VLSTVIEPAPEPSVGRGWDIYTPIGPSAGYLRSDEWQKCDHLLKAQMSALTDHDQALSQLSDDNAQNINRLRDLIEIPSVSSGGTDPASMVAAAVAIRSELSAAGLQDTMLVSVTGAPPYVFGQWLVDPKLPTVLLYAHYDVQPAGDYSGWEADPFVAIERNGRLYGRGTADDKGGVIAHIAVIRAWLKGTGELPLNVKVLIEGEEETGSKHFAALLESNSHLLRADVVVIPDSMNWEIGDPSLTCSTRGAITAIVELRGIDHALHSGVWGGLAPDPIMSMCGLLSTVVGENGAIQLEGLLNRDSSASTRTKRFLRTITAEEVAARIGLDDGMTLSGDPSMSLADRIWSEPCMTVTGFDAPAVDGAPNAIQSVARARINLRLPPSVDPTVIAAELANHLQRHTPKGLRCTVTMTSVQAGWLADLDRPAYAEASRALATAYGRPVSYLGSGGTLPLLRWIGKHLGNPPCIVLGIEDPSSSAHGPNESLDLADWHKLCKAETLLLKGLSGVEASAG